MSDAEQNEEHVMHDFASDAQIITAYRNYLRWLEAGDPDIRWPIVLGQNVRGTRRIIFSAEPRPGWIGAAAEPRERLWVYYLRRFWNWITGRPMPREQFINFLSENEKEVVDYVTEKYSFKMADEPIYSNLEDMFTRINDQLKEVKTTVFNQAKENFLNNLSQLPTNPSQNQFAVVFADYLMKVFDGSASRIWIMEVGTDKNIVNAEVLTMVLDKISSKEIVRSAYGTGRGPAPSHINCYITCNNYSGWLWPIRDMLTLKCTPHKNVIEAAQQSRCTISGRCEAINLEDSMGLFYSDPNKKGNLSQGLLIPLLVPSGEALYVIEIYRESLYCALDLQIANSCCVWGSMALYHCIGWADMTKQFDLTTKVIGNLERVFQEMLSLDVVIQRILKFVQELVYADRASLFMLDRGKKELVSTVFDQKLDGESREKREIRIPMDRGIAGMVARTGQIMNVKDAYKDPRFNREIDETTGYKTKSILCMPIKVDGEIIGVVQMVNKLHAKCFKPHDINAFHIFESFFGLALHHAKLYETIVRNEQKYKVALEVLSYHNTCKDHEVKKLQALEPHKVDCILDDYYLDPYLLDPKKKCQAVIIMFNDLFGMWNFDSNDLTRFTLTVMKNYRDVPYHNFDHGWAVAQTMYAILKNDTDGRFSDKQRLALFVASLCHDLDHRGYTNKYTSDTESPLAAMYSTSTLEHHHFNTTVRILQQEGHNIFSKFSGEEYKEILNLIRVCILATDLAVFYENVYDMTKILFNQHSFDWTSPVMQENAMAMSMTAADLSASAKPWEIQIKTVLVIIEEFYRQGDKEKNAGKTPIAMMDRSKPEEIAISQVVFIESTSIPCYKILKKILPGTIKLYDMAVKNLTLWKEKVKETEKVKTLKRSKDRH